MLSAKGSFHFSQPFPPPPPPHSAAGGEIFHQCVADNDEAFTEKDVVRLARQILTGVACLHRSNVVHLDLKVRIKLFIFRLILYSDWNPTKLSKQNMYWI